MGIRINRSPKTRFRDSVETHVDPKFRCSIELALPLK